MLCPHKFLVGACVICLAERVWPPRKAQPDLHWLKSVEVSSLHQEMPEPHPPTDEAGVLFHAPNVSSAVTGRAEFLQEDSRELIMNLLRPSSRSTHTVLQPSYYSEF